MNNIDERVPLEKGSKIITKNKTYIICSEINRGGSAITYDVKVEGNEPKHYAIKELYPRDYSDKITRNRTNGNLVFNLSQEVKDCLFEEFKKESSIMTECLPSSISIPGKYFLYLEEYNIDFNNTLYIVIDTTNCQTLEQKIKTEPKYSDNLPQLIKVFCDICNALEILHKNDIIADRILHLDISDKNIVISKGTVKLLDFGSAIRIADIDDPEKLKKHIFSFTTEFSPIEIKAAAQHAYYEKIGVESDLYSVCAILFKYTVGRAYEPATDRESTKEWEGKLYHKYGHGPGTNKLIKILKKGLSGFAFRYDSASHLKDDLNDCIKVYKRFKTSKTVAQIVCGIVSVGALFVLTAFVLYPKPTVTLAECTSVNSQYFDGDEILLTFVVTDKFGFNNEFYSNIIEKNIKTHGFDAVVSRTAKPELDGKDKMIYTYSLKHTAFDGDGEKTIEIGEIYKTKWFSKPNVPYTITFEGFVAEPTVIISNPSFTKVNADEHYSVYYDIEFIVPQNMKYDVNLDNVLQHGFASERKNVEKLDEHTYRLTFEELIGPPGEYNITLKEGTCKLENGALSRKVSSPTFEIVEEYVPNFPIRIDLSVVSQDFTNHGFVVLCHSANLPHEYISLIDRSYIHCLGFSANVEAQGDYIILNNLDIDENTEQKLLIDSGAYISKSNGSVSESEVYELSMLLKRKDRGKPVISVISMAKNPVLPGENVTCLIRGNDDSGTFTTKNITSDFIEISGFTANMMIDIQGNDILLTFNNIRPTQDGNSPKITLSQGIYEDSSGNLSSSISFPPFKFVS